MAHFTFRVPDALALAFDGIAALRGGRSRVLRTLIEGAVQTARSADPALAAVATSPRGCSEKITLRLKAEELAALDAVSAEAGLRRTEWAAGCLRGRLLAKPSFNRQEAQALIETRQELARISGSLRDLVRSVREGDTPAEALEEALASVEDFRREVRGQLAQVRAAVEGRGAYWQSAA